MRLNTLYNRLEQPTESDIKMNVLECPLCGYKFEAPTKTVAIRSHTRVDFYWCQNFGCGLFYFQETYTSFVDGVKYPVQPIAVSNLPQPKYGQVEFDNNVKSVTDWAEATASPEPEDIVPKFLEPLKLEIVPLRKEN